MVEVNQKIPDRDEAPLRPAVHGGEPSAVSRVFDKRPRFAGLALDTAPGSRGRGVSKIAERVLDNADDLIHGARSDDLTALETQRSQLLAEIPPSG